MKIVFFGNGRLAVDLLSYLREHADVVGLGTHPAARARYGAELLETAGLTADRVIDGDQLRSPATVEWIRGLDAEMGVSVSYGYIFSPDLLSAFPRGIVNLHPSLLPWNRGAHPNAWALLEHTPAGVTLHQVDAGVDTGPILAQRGVALDPIDTAATAYRKLEFAAAELFRDAWPRLQAGELSPRIQDPGGSVHRVADLGAIQRIDLDSPTTARELLDVLRACTFRPHDSAYFETDDGRKVFVRVSLEYGDAR